MTTRRLKRRQHRVLFVSLLALLLQLAFPPGYMPGNAFDGQAVSLCPIGLPGGFFYEHHHHHHHEHQDESGEWNIAAESCLFSSSLSPEPLTSALVVLPACAASRSRRTHFTKAVAHTSFHFPRYYSRAPPAYSA
ncbi:MAG: hypothetical protein AAF512_15660 [Pseudomonadota bacterium]